MSTFTTEAYDELYGDLLGKRMMTQEERDFISLFADGDDELENPNDNGQEPPADDNQNAGNQQGNPQPDNNNNAGNDDQGEELENPDNNGEDNADSNGQQNPPPADPNAQQNPPPADPNGQQNPPPPADPNAQQNPNGQQQQSKEEIINRRILAFRKHRKLANTIATLQGSVSAAIKHAINIDNRNMLMRVQKDLLTTSGQVEYALSLDFKTIDLTKIEKIYDAMEEKVRIMSEAIKKIRKEDLEA